MAMKKLLFVIESLHCGGAEKSLVTLLNNLDYSNYEVDLILTTKGGAFEKFVPDQVTTIYENIFSNYSKLGSFLARVRFWLYKKIDVKGNYHSSQHFWRAIGKKMKNYTNVYDVAIAYGQGFPTYFVAEKINAGSKYSWLNTDHQKLGYNAKFDYQSYRKFDKVVPVSEDSQRSLIDAMQAIGKTLPTEIIKDISDKDQITKMSQEKTQLDEDSDAKKILTVCRLDKVKGLDMAVEACNILKAKGENIRWYVVGEGTERNFLEEQIKEKGLEENFVLLGFKENPYPYMRVCNIYAQTSLFEGLGLTVIEAAILCKPIVTTNFPTASTIVTHEETGLIAEMNANSIAENISKYIRDDAFTAKIVKGLSKQENNDKEESLDKFNALILSNSSD